MSLNDNLEPTEFELNVWSTYDELAMLLLKKHRDYGPKNISESPGGPVNGLRVRMHDKLARINNLIDNNRDPENEPLEDSFKDMANYAIIGLLVLRGQWNSND
jgi:hypothetical protein